MKTKYSIAALFTIVLFSCAPKVVVQPSEPAVVVLPKPVGVVAATEPISPEKVAEGKKLFENSCANCHKLFSPSEYTRTEWAPILGRMQRKARLDDTQMETIHAYVDMLAKQ